MDDLSRKFRSIDWKGLQKSARRMQASTASALKDMVMTDLENKVRAATADTSWGASGSDLMQIAQGTFNREDYALIMSIVWQRLGSSRWRCVYKALEVLRFLIMHGAARCAEEARSASHHIQTLQHYRFVDPKTRRDHGEGVRTRAKLVCDMLSDDAVLEEEREKSRELRAKLQGGISVGPGGRLGGLSSDDYRYGAGRSSDHDDGVTTTATGGAGNFKGYGDDDDGTAGYDDAPTGSFAKRAAVEAGGGKLLSDDVPDLLGDGGTESAPNENGGAFAIADDDDDDFDPRAGTMAGGPVTGPPAATRDDDLFGSLGLSGTAAQAPPPSHLADSTPAPPAQGQVPTSLLIQSLAQKQYERQQQQVQPQKSDPQAPFNDANLHPSVSPASGFMSGLSVGPNGNGVSANSNAQPNTGTSVQPSVPPKPKVTSKPEADPFGDLMASAKKSGVL